jgi:hypothetical protein
MNNLPKRTDNEKIKFCEETTKLFIGAQVAFVTLGERLKVIRDEHLYAPAYDSFNAYLLEINDISMSQVSRLISIHEKFVLNAGIPEDRLSKAGWTKLGMTLPFVTTKEEAEEWAEKAETLTRSYLRKTISELRTGKDMSKCEHEEKHLTWHCPKCKDKWQAVDVSVITVDQLNDALQSAGLDLEKGIVLHILTQIVNTAENL